MNAITARQISDKANGINTNTIDSIFDFIKLEAEKGQTSLKIKIMDLSLYDMKELQLLGYSVLPFNLGNEIYYKITW